ncbi:MAG: phosphoribosylformylglycinamidine synthase subunit PurL [Calditrichaeota bacterium]|nr:phosphoribosylformylglycinamidine synthase subunit PurL [Calditrichota bacterium]RQV99081.1 MAG: phosphoribosylformylglycinamidine synthase subunit PurL [Calditrichota bacterium]
MKEPRVNLELALQHGLSEEEYDEICKILQRTPSFTELGIFSVMWSEHCSYKNSIAELKKLPRSGGPLLVGAGEENAGLVDIGEKLAVCFKIESHNHPSAVEPYQGAATGVGGIMRDIFTMGARPIAALDSLRFGRLDKARNRYLFDGVVRGIADYGNCLGVPTVAGEVYFEDCYGGNPLVNAMTLGIVKHDQTASAVAKGEGNPVFVVGSRTGRDGIHGATFASEELTEESESRRPNVQVGDPFTEKLLLEATLEMIRENLLVGIQDMGAAGITCSTTEMSAKGISGMIIDLDKVPVREEGMTPYEIMLSESQERMLVVGRQGMEDEIAAVCQKWELIFEKVGIVTDEPRLKVFFGGDLVADIPPSACVLGGGAPVYHREYKRPEYLDTVQQKSFDDLEPIEDIKAAFLKVFSSGNIVSKHWVYEQYDHMVRTNTAVFPGAGDAAVIRIKKTKKALAMKTDGNGRYVYLNPRRGGQIAVAEAARNIVCVGGQPLAITNCLNFGNPYKPEMFYMFREAVAGMGEACRVLNTPVTGGNVSFYNESPESAVYPTPVIGMVGLIENINHITAASFKKSGDTIYLIGKTLPEIGGSEFLKEYYSLVTGDCPALDLALEKKIQAKVLETIRNGWINSAHDISDGGLAVALAECCILNRNKKIGAVIELPSPSMRREWFLFSESQSRIIISVSDERREAVEKIFLEANIPMHRAGTTGGEKLVINDWLDLSLDELNRIYYETLRNKMEE